MSKLTEAMAQYTSLEGQDLEAIVQSILNKKMDPARRKEALGTILSCIDLTSLNTSDTEESVSKLTIKVNNFGENYPELPNVAGICVYPSLVKAVRETLTDGVEITGVAGGFPHSQTFIEVKIAEVSLAVIDGASEIDIVFPVGKLQEGKRSEIMEDLQELKSACQHASLKVILESGILSTKHLQEASILAMEAGADFIKTSTGKLEQGASTTAVYCMCQMIKQYAELSGRKVGMKVAGGVKTTEEALMYYQIIEAVLGKEWMNKDLLRFGASRLANEVVNEILGTKANPF